MKDNSLKKLAKLGQSIWLDYIQRDLIVSGKLRHMIEKDGLLGMTSNPSIFEKAITESHDYDSDIRAMVLAGKGVKYLRKFSTVHDLRNLLLKEQPFSGYYGLVPVQRILNIAM